MAKVQQKTTSIQADIFQQLAEHSALEAADAVDLDIGPELAGAVNSAIRAAKKQGLSRDRIIERMNLCLPDMEKPLTLRQLNAWTAQSKEFHEFPSRFLPAFCWATGSVLPLLAMANAINHDLVDAREHKAMELGNTLVESARLSRKAKALKDFLGGEL